MILAAGRCALGKGEAPPSLLLAWRANRYKTLPEAGGLRDQRAGELDQMDAARNVYDSVKSWAGMFYGGEAGALKQWMTNNRDVWRIVQDFIKLDMTDG